jgi:hypothetical protein
MTTITITPLEFITAIDFADKTLALVNLAESLFGAVDVAFELEPDVWSDGYEAGRRGDKYDPSRRAEFKEGYSAGHITRRNLAVTFDDNAPHRKYQEGRDMDETLADLRSGKVPLIVRLTDTQLAEIEASRWGE